MAQQGEATGTTGFLWKNFESKNCFYDIHDDTFVAIYIEIFPFLTLLFIIRGLLPLRAPCFCLLIRLTRASFSCTFSVKFLYSIKHLLRVTINQILLTFASLWTLYTIFLEMSSWLTGKQPTYYCFNSLKKKFLDLFLMDWTRNQTQKFRFLFVITLGQLGVHLLHISRNSWRSFSLSSPLNFRKFGVQLAHFIVCNGWIWLFCRKISFIYDKTTFDDQKSLLRRTLCRRKVPSWMQL